MTVERGGKVVMAIAKLAPLSLIVTLRVFSVLSDTPMASASRRMRSSARSAVGEEFLLARRRKAGHGPTVRWRARWGIVLRWRPHPLVAQEALDAFWVTHESPQLHAAPAGRTLADGAPPDVTPAQTVRAANVATLQPTFAGNYLAWSAHRL